MHLLQLSIAHKHPKNLLISATIPHYSAIIRFSALQQTICYDLHGCTNVHQGIHNSKRNIHISTQPAPLRLEITKYILVVVI